MYRWAACVQDPARRLGDLSVQPMIQAFSDRIDWDGYEAI